MFFMPDMGAFVFAAKRTGIEEVRMGGQEL
jgi:hypothetical protein